MDAEQRTDSSAQSLQEGNLRRKTGRIIVTGVSHINDLPCDEIWQIMRGGADISGTVRVRALAPGDNLFHKYIKQWKDTDPEEWWSLYKAQFTKELSRVMINKLIALAKSGKTIVLFCFCRNAGYCHRSIVARVLQEQGAPVEVYEPAPAVDRSPAPESRQLTLDELLTQ